MSHRLSALLLTLSNTHCFLYPTIREDGITWQEGHAKAFTFWGGAPRRLIPDNLAAGILKADLYDPRINRAYGELTRYYGCLVDPSRIRKPTDKPRVERNVDYARHSCFDGKDFSTLEEWRREAVRWSLEVAGQRVHGTTKERPLEAFLAREQAALLPLPPKPWEAVTWDTVLVNRDCHIRVAGEDYTVPAKYLGRHLDVRYTRKMVQRADEELSELSPDVAHHQLRDSFGDLAWIVPWLLDLSEGVEVYFDAVTQIVMPSWQHERVTLVGDACGCVSLLAGQGASLAVTGACTLAAAVAESDDVAIALRLYEQRMRPLVAGRQRAGRRFARWFVPDNRARLALRDVGLRFVGWPPVARLAEWRFALGGTIKI